MFLWLVLYVAVVVLHLLRGVIRGGRHDEGCLTPRRAIGPRSALPRQIRYKRIWGSTRRGPIARRGLRPLRSAPDENHDEEQMSCASVVSEEGTK